MTYPYFYLGISSNWDAWVFPLVLILCIIFRLAVRWYCRRGL